MRIICMVWKGFVDDNCPLHASALTYTTLLSIVPFLAVLFSISKGLGIKVLEPLLLNETITGIGGDVIKWIVSQAKDTNTTALGALGGGVLIIMAVKMLSTVENSFNTIWGVKRSRSIFRKTSDYLSVLIVGPVLVAAAIAITASLENISFAQIILSQGIIKQLIIHFVPFVSLWIAFTGVYIFMPNIRVKIQHALIGGVIAGTIWQIVQWVYINFGIGVAKYNAIYGGFAQFPLFLIWLYISWLIVLFGAEISFASQNVKTYTQEKWAQSASYSFREELVLYLITLISVNFYTGKTPWTVEKISKKLNVSSRLVKDLLFQLCKTDILYEVNGDITYYQPAAALEKISLEKILNAVKNYGGNPLQKIKIENKQEKYIKKIINNLNQATKNVVANVTLRDLVLKIEADKEK
ncbi:YihY/virulence factor BrkB family protein [bacterium]|nr:YihY/virulence factor BrkB family protein [bacterium]